MMSIICLQRIIMIDKEKAIKLDKKLEQRKLTIQEALQEDIAVDWLKTSNPAFLSMLTPQNTAQIIQLLIVPGPPHDKIRSFKIPQIAAQLLSTMVPKIYELLFQEDPEQKGSPLLNRLMKYFDSPPNYVISGYVSKILLNLFPANPTRILQFIFRSQPERLLKYVESHSIAQLITRIIIVEDALLNGQIKERVSLLSDIVNLFIENKADEDQLSNINWILIESITRLWTQKHKELGRFSSTLFRLVQAVIDNNSLYQQESIIIAVCKQVSVYQKQAPFLIAALYKKIYQELSQARNEGLANSKPKLTSKRYKNLQALYFIIAQGADAITKQLTTNNIFHTLLDFISRYQWHNLALIEIQKIFKAAFSSSQQAIFAALSRSYIGDKLKQLGKIHQNQGKKGCGFSGVLVNIATNFKETFDNSSGYGAWLKQNKTEGDIDHWLTDFLLKKKEGEQKMRVVHEVAKPFYSISKLPDLFREFFDETEAINARMLTQSPSKHQQQRREVLQQIENENKLVYQWMSQTPEGSTEDKKPQQTCE